MKLKKRKKWLLGIGLIGIISFTLLSACVHANQNNHSKQPLNEVNVDLKLDVGNNRKEESNINNQKSMMHSFLIYQKHQLDKNVYKFIDTLIDNLGTISFENYDLIKDIFEYLNTYYKIIKKKTLSYNWYFQLNIHNEINATMNNVNDLVVSYHDTFKLNETLLNTLRLQITRAKELFDLYENKWLNKFQQYLSKYQTIILNTNQSDINHLYIKRFEKILESDFTSINDEESFKNAINWFDENTNNIGIIHRNLFKIFNQWLEYEQKVANDVLFNHKILKSSSDLVYEYIEQIKFLLNQNYNYDKKTMESKTLNQIVLLLKKIEQLNQSAIGFNYFLEYNTTWKTNQQTDAFFDSVYTPLSFNANLNDHPLITSKHNTNVKFTTKSHENYKFVYINENEFKEGTIIYNPNIQSLTSIGNVSIVFNNNSNLVLSDQKTNQHNIHTIMLDDINDPVLDINIYDHVYVSFKENRHLKSKNKTIIKEIKVKVNDVVHTIFVFDNTMINVFKNAISKTENSNKYLHNLLKTKFQELFLNTLDFKYLYNTYQELLELYLKFLKQDTIFQTYEYINYDNEPIAYKFNALISEEINNNIFLIHELKSFVNDEDILSKIRILFNDYEKTIYSKYKSSNELITLSIKVNSILEVIRIYLHENKKNHTIS